MAPVTFEEFMQNPQAGKSLQRYDATGEPKYPHKFWELDRSKIGRLLKEISQLVANITTGAPENDRELKHVLNSATGLEHVTRTSTTKVALIGAQGAGKSLLINALFNIDGLSLTGADGSACTSTIVKYARYTSGSTTDAEKKFTAEVKFLDDGKRREMIKEHVRSYAHYHNDLGDSDDDDEDMPETRSFEKDELDKRLKDTAEDIFQTLYGSRDQFLEEWASSGSDPKEFSQTCLLKCDEALMDQHVEQKVKTFCRTDQRKLLEDLKPFLTKVKGKVCLWPLVDCITIRFDNELLQHGIEIIDLPGSGDVNLSRTRHADQIKNSVDVEIILADTIRITTDNMLINTARAALLHHGASNVKLVATKIDMLSENQLLQCTGDPYDRIKALIESADRDALQADEEDDTMKSSQLDKYKTYLERELKREKVVERQREISHEMALKLQGRTPDDFPETIHTSASEYMKWITKDRILFKDQPALDPVMSGIPGIRKYLFTLPTQQYLKDYMEHISVSVPAFFEKLKRITTQSDRDAGFKTIADEFDMDSKRLILDSVSQTKSAFHRAHHIEKIRADTKSYRQAIDAKLRKQWFMWKGPTFSKILRSRGFILHGSSRAKGLESGCNWNRELADILAPGFRKWEAAFSQSMKEIKAALFLFLDQLYLNIVSVLDSSTANLVTVETAKAKWKLIRPNLQSKILCLMSKVDSERRRLFLRATMEDGREDTLIASITDKIYSEVYHSEPELKETQPGKPKRYVIPKVRFQKQLMGDLFLKPNNHFIEQLLKKFDEELHGMIESQLDNFFDDIEMRFLNYSKNLRDRAPIEYTITSHGQRIREELKEIIPELEVKASDLRALLPTKIKQEPGSETPAAEPNFGNTQRTLEDFLNQDNKAKKGSNDPTKKRRIKKEDEPSTKRSKI